MVICSSFLRGVVLTSFPPSPPSLVRFYSDIVLKESLCFWPETVHFRPYGNKMVALKVPAVQSANCSQVKGNRCCKQRTSSCFVSWWCRISGLAKFTDEPLFPGAKKKKCIGLWSQQLFLQYMCYYVNWEMHGRITCSHEFKIPCVLATQGRNFFFLHFSNTRLLSHTMHCCSRLIEF